MPRQQRLAHSLTVSPLQFFVEAVRLNVMSQMTIKALKISTTQLIFRQCGLIPHVTLFSKGQVSQDATSA